MMVTAESGLVVGQTLVVENDRHYRNDDLDECQKNDENGYAFGEPTHLFREVPDRFLDVVSPVEQLILKLSAVMF